MEQLLLWDGAPGWFFLPLHGLFRIPRSWEILMLDQTMGWSRISVPWGVTLWDCHREFWQHSLGSGEELYYLLKMQRAVKGISKEVSKEIQTSPQTDPTTAVTPEVIALNSCPFAPSWLTSS